MEKQKIEPHIKILSNKVFICFAFICIYKILLEYDFDSYFSRSTGIVGPYFWFAPNETISSFFVSWLLIVVSFRFVCTLLKERVNHFSTQVMLLIYLLSYVPITTCVTYGTISNDCLVWLIGYESILFVVYELSFSPFVINWFHRYIKFSVKPLKNTKIILLCSIVVMSVVVYISYKYAGLHLHFSLNNIYDLRMAAREYPLSFLIRLIFLWTHNLLPLFFCFFLLRKYFFLAFVVVCVSFLSFGIDGAKYPLFILGLNFLIILLYMLNGAIDFRICSVLGLLSVVVIGIIDTFVGGGARFNNLMIGRILLIPTNLHEWYYQFFWGREADFFRTNLRHFGVEGPYASFGGVAKAIGDFLGSPLSHANNGLFSDAISNLGIPWLLIMPVAVVIVLRFFDQCTINLDAALVAVMSVQMAIGLISSPIISLLFAGGGILFMPLALLMSREPIGDADG